MRLRLRPKTNTEDGLLDAGGGSIERSAPPNAVVTWLHQGMRLEMCPLCRVEHKADREYIWQFFDEGDRKGESIDELRASCGFCAEHMEMLRRIEVDGMHSTLGISTVFAETFAGIVEDLEAQDPAAPFTRAPCPACASREGYLDKNSRYLLDDLATSPGRKDAFEVSPGLCFAHFERVWNAARTREDRELLLRAQLRASRELLADLREHVRKHDHKFANEPKGAERDSWERAIRLTAGWPPPAGSAAEPEQRG